MASGKRPRLTHDNGFVDLTFDDEAEEPIPRKKAVPKQEVNGMFMLKKEKPESSRQVERVTETIATVSLVSPDATSVLVEKYKPKSSAEIIGQAGDRSNAAKLSRWLSSWYENREAEKTGVKKKPKSRFVEDDGSSFRAVLLSGPPGIGKTTTAQLVLTEAGFVFKELNASDTRNQKSLKEEISVLKNKVLDGHFKAAANPFDVTAKKANGVTAKGNSKSKSNGTAAAAPTSDMNVKHAVIMDEVDGMAGNEDRGGVGEMIKLIKETKIPIICICNDRSCQKMRSLVTHCYDLRFYKPRPDLIKLQLKNIATSEGVQVSDVVLDEIIASSNQDIRQSINYLNMMSAKKNLNRVINSKAMKDVQLGPFEAIKKVFPTGFDMNKKTTLSDKCDLFFFDYNLMPLMVYENYVKTQQPAGRSPVDKLKAIARSADAIAFGDMIEKNIRSSQSWGLLPLQSVFSVAMPSFFMKSSLNAMPMFPTFLGRMSNLKKRDRLLQELKFHMNLKISGTKTALALDYLEPLRNGIMTPLKEGDVSGTVDFLNSYFLGKEDLDSIFELAAFTGEKDPYSTIDSKTKAALTRAINKSDVQLPYYNDSDVVKRTVGKGKGRGKAVKISSKNDGDDDDDEVDDAEMEDDVMSYE